jgi:tetratricopeptide (TPR) repeat protein
LRLALAEVERARGDAAAAEKILRQILDANAASLEALRALDALLREQQRPAERATILAERAAREEPATRVPLMIELAELQANVLGDAAAGRATLESALLLGDDERVLRALARVADDDTAVTLWQRLCAQSPRDPEALSALASLYERHERWRELAAVLDEQLAVAGDDTAPTLVEQLALVWTRLADHARAEAAWRRVAALRPEATDPLQALVRLVRGQERWSELAELLERLVALEPGSAATAKQLARLETETLERPERAIAAWQRVLDLDAGDDEALSALDGLYARTGRAEPRRHVLERRAELALAAGRADAVALAVDAGATAAADGDATAAARLYERVLTVEPLHDAAGAFLAAHHRERADWPALVSLYRLRARHRTGAERGELYAQVSGIEEHELGDRRAAFASLLEALEADGRFAVHGDDLRRLAGAVDGWPMLCGTLQRRAAAAGPAERSDAYLDLGGALEEAKQLAAAIEAYRALLAVEPTNLTALERLQGLYRIGGQSAQLDVLARRAELTADRDDQLALYRELAAEAGRMERWGRAVEAHRRLAELDPRGERRGVELYRAGVIYRDQLAEFDEALGCFASAADIYSADGLEPPSELAEALARLKRRSARAQERS